MSWRPSFWTVSPEQIQKVMPADHRLAVWKLPFTRKFALTWWLDGEGKIARRDR